MVSTQHASADMEATVQHLASNLLVSYHAGQNSRASLLLDKIEQLCNSTATSAAAVAIHQPSCSTAPAKTTVSNGAGIAVLPSEHASVAAGGHQNSPSSAAFTRHQGAEQTTDAQPPAQKCPDAAVTGGSDATLTPDLLLKLAVNIRDPDGNMLLHMAAHRGDAAFIKRLLACGAWHSATAQPADNTPLHVAALKGHLQVVKTLLNAGALVDAQNSGGNTPLTLACGAGHAGVALQLLKAGASLVGAATGNVTPIMAAAANNHGLVVQALLRSAGQNNIQRGGLPGSSNTNMQAVGDSLKDAYTGAVHAMLQCTDEAGNTALHYAARAGHLDVVKLLVEAGADMAVRNTAGRSPLVEARLASSQQCHDYLHARWLANCPTQPLDVAAVGIESSSAGTATERQDTAAAAGDVHDVIPSADGDQQGTAEEPGSVTKDGKGGDSLAAGAAAHSVSATDIAEGSSHAAPSQLQHDSTATASTSSDAPALSELPPPEEEWVAVGKGHRQAVDAAARTGQAIRQPGHDRQSRPGRAQGKSNSNDRWQPKGAGMEQRSDSWRAPVVASQQHDERSHSCAGPAPAQHVGKPEEATAVVQPAPLLQPYKRAAVTQLVPQRGVQHQQQPSQQTFQTARPTNPRTTSTTSASRIAQPKQLPGPRSPPPGICSRTASASNKPQQHAGLSQGPPSPIKGSASGFCPLSTSQLSDISHMHGSAGSVGIKQESMAVGTAQQAMTPSKLPAVTVEQRPPAEDMPIATEDGTADLEDTWAQARTQLEEACPEAAALDILPQHVCGVGLHQLSYSQLEALEAVHHAALARLVEAKVTLARQQERARITEAALRRLQVEQRRAQMVVDAATAAEAAL